MRFFAPRTTTNSFKTHSAWVPGSGLVQIAVSSMLRLDCPNSTQLYLRSTVDTALQIYRQLSYHERNPERPFCECEDWEGLCHFATRSDARVGSDITA